MYLITNYPLFLIKKLILESFESKFPDYKVELCALDDLYDEELEPYEDLSGEMMQNLKVSVIFTNADDNDPAREWQHWIFTWNCNKGEFKSFELDNEDVLLISQN